MALKDKYPFINQLHYNDILADLLNATDSIGADINALVSGYSGDNASTKKIYWHTIYFERKSPGYRYINGFVIILNNSSTPIDFTAFKNLVNTQGFYAVVINGFIGDVGEVGSSPTKLCAIYYSSNISRYSIAYYDTNNDLQSTVFDFVDSTVLSITDLGANPIN